MESRERESVCVMEDNSAGGGPRCYLIDLVGGRAVSDDALGLRMVDAVLDVVGSQLSRTRNHHHTCRVMINSSTPTRHAH